MDGIMLKVKQNGRFINKCVFLVIGLRRDGRKEVLGMWIAENESSSFWLNVLTDLKARGVEDILIACTDNLKGFTEAIKAVFPFTATQLCIVHQIRNSCQYVIWKDRKAFCADLKDVYNATNRDAAETALSAMEQKWGEKYGYAFRSWRNNWDNLTIYFDYPMEIRKIIYTTNAIESLNRTVRKYTKPKVQFVDDMAALKAVYLAIMNQTRTWTQPIPNWGLVLNQLMIIFGDRCKMEK
jgi:transposase-like protein